MRRYNIFFHVALVLVFLAFSGCAKGKHQEKEAKKGKKDSERQEQNGPGTIAVVSFGEKNPSTETEYNSSGAACWPDGRLFFVDNRCPGALFFLVPDGSGGFQNTPQPLPLGTTVGDCSDFEGLTAMGNGTSCYLVAVCSFQRTEIGSNAGGLVRVSIQGDRASAENMPGFHAWLLQQYPFLRENYSLNVEAVAWHPGQSRLLLGLRSPTQQGLPIILPLQVKEMGGPWNTANLAALPAIRLKSSLSPQAEEGVRGMEYDSSLGGFWLILGASQQSGGNVPFRLCTWTGDADAEPKTVPGIVFPPKMKPESVTPALIGGKGMLAILDDGGGYSILPKDDPRLNPSPQ